MFSNIQINIFLSEVVELQKVKCACHFNTFLNFKISKKNELHLTIFKTTLKVIISLIFLKVSNRNWYIFSEI